MKSFSTLRAALAPARSRSAKRLASGILTASLVATVSAPAAASLLPEEIKDALDYVNDGLAPFKTAQSVLNLIDQLFGSAPSLSDQLAGVEQRLLDEMRFFVVDVSLRSASDAAFRKYQELLQNPGQTSLNRERIAFLTGASSSNDASDVLLELERLIEDGSGTLQYQLAAPFNTLATMMGEAMVLHDEYFPEEAAFSWASFHDHFNRTLNVDYKLVGATALQCWPGFNPGQAQVRPQLESESSSDLWQLLANKFYSVGQYTCSSPPSPIFVNINPVSQQFQGGILRNCSIGAPSNIVMGGRSFPTLASALPHAFDFADQLGTLDFVNDPLVSALKSNMRTLIAMSGGDLTAGGGDPNRGEFFDPRVSEPNLCGPSGPFAYIFAP